MTTPPRPQVSLATARQPGAVALVQLHGEGIAPLLHELTGVRDWPAGRLRLVELSALDQGLAVCLTGQWAQLMPHGGPRVVQKLIDHLLDLGCTYISEPTARVMYPEAGSELEAHALAAIAWAASPAAIDLLAAQPALWRNWRAGGQAPPPGLLDRSVVLDRLIEPPAVVVVGPPNVGKSTLTNRMLGRSASLVADLPGTTRDWVAGLAELVPSALPTAAIAVRWMDTPGLRVSEDAIEQEAIALAQQVVAQAEVLIAMRDPQSDWPTLAALPREPDVWVVNKVDDAAAVDGLTAGASRAAPLAISAERDRNIDALQRRVLGVLGLDALGANELWAFCAPLRDALRRGDVEAVRDWV